MYIPLNQSIIIRDLTCKLSKLFEKSVRQGFGLNKPLFITKIIFD